MQDQVRSGVDLYIPKKYQVMEKIALEPFWTEFEMSLSYWEAALKNIVGFIPLGFWFYACLHCASPQKAASHFSRSAWEPQSVSRSKSFRHSFQRGIPAPPISSRIPSAPGLAWSSTMSQLRSCSGSLRGCPSLPHRRKGRKLPSERNVRPYDDTGDCRQCSTGWLAPMRKSAWQSRLGYLQYDDPALVPDAEDTGASSALLPSGL